MINVEQEDGETENIDLRWTAESAYNNGDFFQKNNNLQSEIDELLNYGPV